MAIDKSISIFPRVSDTKPSGTMTVPDFISGVKYGTWEAQVKPIRAISNKQARNEAKKYVTQVTISGTFSPTRSEANLIDHSGYICIDIDEEGTDRQELLADPYTFGLFSSISGEQSGGLAVIVRINGDKHKESFRWLQWYYYKTYGITIDPAPQNVSSQRCVSVDYHAHINEQSKKSLTKSLKRPKISSLPAVFPMDTVSELVAQAVASGANLAENYDEYRDLGFALASGFGEDGRQYFHALCSISEKYRPTHTDRQYNICLKRPNSGITVGTFYWMLKNAGIKLPRNKQYEKATAVAAMGKKAGRPAEAIVEQLITINNIPAEDAARIAAEVMQRDDIELKTIAYDPEHLIQSMMGWLLQEHPFRRNYITDKIERPDGTELSDPHMNTVYLHARASFNTPSVNFDLVDRMVKSDFTPTFHPMKEYIEQHRHLKGEGQIKAMAACIRSDTPGYEMFIRKWIISIPAAIDGHPVRSVLSLLGGEGLTGKTEWFRRLLPEALKRYYGESKLDAGKDDEILMCQKLVLMQDEMGGKTRNDDRKFKELTSKDWFSLRVPYGHYNADYKRLALLCGTSNDLDIINDSSTNNTRILPVHVLYVDRAAYNLINKDELFMEAVRIYEGGEDWNLSDDEIDHLGSLTPKYESVAIERELILQFFQPASAGGYVELMSATMIKDFIEKSTQQRILSLKKFGTECRSIFGERKSCRVGGNVMQCYNVVKQTFSVNSQQTEQNNNNPSINKQNVTDKQGGTVTVQPPMSQDDALPF